MADRNARLARENSALKASLSGKLDEHEEMLKKCIKSEYFGTLAYRKAVEAIDESTRCLKVCLLACRRARAALEAQHHRQGIPGAKNGSLGLVGAAEGDRAPRDDASGDGPGKKKEGASVKRSAGRKD